MNPLLNKEIRKILIEFLGHKVGDVEIVKVTEDGEFSKLILTAHPENEDKKYQLTYRTVNNPKNTDLSARQGDQ